jgi:hypothetical protein
MAEWLYLLFLIGNVPEYVCRVLFFSVHQVSVGMHLQICQNHFLIHHFRLLFTAILPFRAIRMSNTSAVSILHYIHTYIL